MPSSEVRGRVTLEDASRKADQAPKRFAGVFAHGTLEVEFYAPRGVDPQKPHTRDEIYVVARGSGWFRSGPARDHVQAGDFLFVPAGMEHRFEEFSDDFGAWVFFYGPEGGETP
jgi:mannose-6-phosphate isomerase-like protein (cupin superfamily)